MELITIFVLILVTTVVVLLYYIILEKRKRKNIEERILRSMFDYDKVNVKDEILTQNEQRFYRDLQNKFGDKYYIFSHVNLHALLKIKEGLNELHWSQNQINKFAFDFVLCLKENFKPQLVIELNDRTHHHFKRKKRDSYFTTMLNSAQIKYLSIESNYLTYDHFMEEIKKLLNA